MSPRAKAAVTAAFAAALLSAIVVQQRVDIERAAAAEPEQRTLSRRVPPRASTSLPGTLAAPAARAAPISAQAPLPSSLEGTEADGSLEADGRGRLVLGPGVRRYFEHFLSAEGEESLAAVRARVVAGARARLPAAAAGEVEALFDRYLHYRDAGRGLRQGEGLAPEQAFARIAALRKETLGEEAAAALFADSAPLDALAVARLALAGDQSLTGAERASREAALESGLPPALRAARLLATEPLRLDAEEAAMRGAGASADELAAAREQTSGREAAQRLAELDRARAQWQERLSDFARRRAALEQEEPVQSAREERLHQLLAELFSPREQLRVLALARVPGR